MENTETIQFGETPTLRDQFAMAVASVIYQENDNFSDMATQAYRIADAMLAEREK